MPIKTLYICIFFVLALQFSESSAQTKNYKVRHFTTDNGLPQNSITTISFDNAGYCWLGTEMGLVRYDGNSFRIFNSYNMPELRSDRMKLAAFDSSHNLYIQNDYRQRLIIPEHNKSNNKSVVPQLLDTSSPVCVANGYIVRNASFRKQEVSINRFLMFHLQAGEVYGIDEDKVYYAVKDSFKTVYSIQNKNDLKYLTAGDVFLLFEENKTMKAWKKGVLQPDITDIQGPIQQNKDYKSGRFSFHTTHSNSYIYAGTTLYEIVTRDNMVTSRILLEDLNIRVMSRIYYHAASRSYYIGSLVDGLYIIKLSDFNFLEPLTGTVDNGFYSQVITKEGAIICQRSLYRNGRSPTLLPIPKNPGASLFLSADQRLYYGDDPRLFYFDLPSASGKMIAVLDSRPSSIYQDKTDNNVIILTSSHSIYKMINDSLRLTNRMAFDADIIRSIQTGKDSFLLATDAGLKWYDLKRNSIYRSVLHGIYVRALHIERNGSIWIGTYNKGSYLYENNKLYAIPDTDHEALRTIHCFIEDSGGSFWLPTNNGLYTIKKEVLRKYAKKERDDVFYYRYTVFDNLPTNEFNGGCTPNYLWTKDSLLSLPTIEGIVQFDPNAVKPMLPDNEIYLDEIRLNDSIVHVTGGNSLTVGPDYGRLSITISCPYFGSPDNRKLMYKIEGVGNQWQQLSPNGKIELNAVAAGIYRVLVRKVTGNTADQRDYFQFTITVQPWFYNTWWFHALIITAIAVILLTLTKMRIRYLKQRNLRLQAIVQEQTSDLNRTVTQLQHSEQALKESNQVKEAVITMVLHDLRSPIRFLNTVSHQLMRRYTVMTPEEMGEKFTLLKSGTESLNSFTEQFFAWAVSHQHTFSIFKETFMLQSLFTELEDLYSAIIITHNNRLTIHPTDLELYTDKNILSVVIRNLLDNANKNTKNGSIEISANMNHGITTITVMDNGIGLSSDAIEDYYSGKASGINGNGRIIVMNLLQKIGGKLTIQSAKYNKTVFSIELIHR